MLGARRRTAAIWHTVESAVLPYPRCIVCALTLGYARAMQDARSRDLDRARRYTAVTFKHLRLHQAGAHLDEEARL